MGSVNDWRKGMIIGVDRFIHPFPFLFDCWLNAQDKQEYNYVTFALDKYKWKKNRSFLGDGNNILTLSTLMGPSSQKHPKHHYCHDTSIVSSLVTLEFCFSCLCFSLELNTYMSTCKGDEKKHWSGG